MVSIKPKPKIAIIGLGNILLTDDGIGVHAINELKKIAPKEVVICDIGTAVMDSLELLKNVDFVIAIDAAQGGSEPGTIYCFDAKDAHVEKSFSVHDLGLLAALHYLPAQLRPQIMILGVEHGEIDYGMELSNKVQAMLPKVVKTALTIVEQIQNDNVFYSDLIAVKGKKI